jgi:hypothetical protein
MRLFNDKRVYFIQDKGETLSVGFIEHLNSVQVIYRKNNQSQIGYYQEGREVSRMIMGSEQNYIEGYKQAYERLGSKLKKQLPLKWKKILGAWFDSENERAIEKEVLAHLKYNVPILDRNSIGSGKMYVEEQELKGERVIDWSKDLGELVKDKNLKK